MNRLALFCFIKNEESIIESFVKHHINIFDEITIIDNGSTDNTLDIIKQYPQIRIIHDHSDFKYKGQICSEIMKQSTCDLLVPMDADEVMVYDSAYYSKQVSKSAPKIRTYLQNIALTEHKYQIYHVYDYIPFKQNAWCYSVSNNKKIIFPRKTFMYTDCGFHRGRVSVDDPSSFSDPFFWRGKNNDKINRLFYISYLHFHFRDLDFWKQNTEKKLKSRLGDNWNNIEFLRQYNGQSKHLAEQYVSYMDTGGFDKILSEDIYFEIVD